MIVTVFSGTSEGKEISHYLAELGISVNVSVATEYGKNVTPQQKNINIAVGRLNADEMLGFIKDSSFVIDATHPYAQIVTQNIKSACEVADIKYIRLLRDSVDSDKVIEAENISQAVEYLKHTQGKIFVSTGSKELNLYSAIKDYKTRLVVRVLPVDMSRQVCRALEINNVIYDKGPFSYNQNYNSFKEYDVKWLVTKNSGTAGGFAEKLQAADALGVRTIVIKRPDETGLAMEQVKEFFSKEVEKCH